MKLGGGNAGIYESWTHRAQVAAAHDAGLRADRYWFNGPGVRETSAVADQVIAIKQYLAATPPLRLDEKFVWDVEDEESMPHWTPAEVVQAAQLLADVVPLARQEIYLSASVTRNVDWSPVVALGLPVWAADYGLNDGTQSSVPLVATGRPRSCGSTPVPAGCPAMTGTWT